MLKKKNIHKWFLLGVVSLLLSAPNPTVIRFTVQDIDPNVYNIIRFGLIAICLTPYIFAKRKLLNSRGFKYSVLVGVSLFVAAITYVWAIRLSTASYVSVLLLTMPIIFILYSMRLEKQRINRRSFAGISLAAAGAFVIVALPIILNKQADFVFYPLATVLALVQCLAFPLVVIFSKKAHQSDTPVAATIGISAWCIVGLSLLAVLITGANFNLEVLSPKVISGAAYSGLIVSLAARALAVLSYEKVGAVVTAALGYAESLVAIIIPVIVLHERLSIEMVAGGVLILLGVYMVEHHKSSNHKHAHHLRHH